MKRWYMIVAAIAIVILVWFLMGLRIDPERRHPERGTIDEIDENLNMIPEINDYVYITVNKDKPLFYTNFTFGVTHTHNHWYNGHPDAVQRAVDILNEVSSMDNHHIMGWGPLNPWQNPNEEMNFDSIRWRDNILERLSGNTWLTLCTAPGWMKCQNPEHIEFPADCCIAADWEMNQSPIPEHYNAFAELAKALVYEFEISTVQVWNELKGFWHDDTKYPNRPWSWWDYEEYTIFYNIVYDAIRSTTRDINIGGFYLILEGDGTYEAFGDRGSHSYTTMQISDIWPQPERQIQAVKYFLEHANGMDYFLIDRGLVNYHRNSDPTSEQLFQLTSNFSISMQEVLSLLKDSDFAHVPIVWSEFYGDSEILRDNALKNRKEETDEEIWDYIRRQVGALYASIYYHMIIGAKGHDTNALLWLEFEQNIPHVLFTNTDTATGGQPTPHFFALRDLLKYFPKGTMLYEVEVSSPILEVLASDSNIFIINKSTEYVNIIINGSTYKIEPYEVRVI